MNSVPELKALLHKINDQKNPYLVVHSSLLPFKKFEKPLEQSIQALREYADETGVTLFLPTFTFKSCKSGYFNPETTPSEMGMLSEAFRKQPGTLRGIHPIDSYVSYGKEKDRVLEFFGETLHGKGSASDFFHQKNALILGWGANLSYFTIFHYYEFQCQVPYRFYKTFEGMIDQGGKQKPYQFRFFVRDYNRISELPHVRHLHELFMKNLPVKHLELHGAPFFATEARNFGEFLIPHLKKHPLALLSNPDFFLASQKKHEAP